MNTTTLTDRYLHSTEAFASACRVMPGGVNSPVRAYQAVGRSPVFIRNGKGARITDLDENTYIDYVLSYGPLILGHAPDSVVAAISKTACHGSSFGMPTTLETKLAELVIESVPSIERVRFVNSGTEAVMSAIRLARAATGRCKIIKFTGGYHGHSDALLISAGSGATTLAPAPGNIAPGNIATSSPGVTEGATNDTLLVPYNNLQAVRQTFEANRDQVACLCVEPIAGNMGLVPPAPEGGFLEGLRALCDEFGVLLLFDEVMTGFRVALGGAQELYNITPDLTCLGKIIGGGLPCAAYGGRDDLMQQIAPSGPVYQAGTLSGNPLAMAAGIATLQVLRETDAYEQLEASGQRLEAGLQQVIGKSPIQFARVGSMVGLFFNDKPVTNYEQATQSRTDRFALFFQHMLDRGIMLAPSQYEAWFLSTAHDNETIDETIAAAEQAIAAAMAL